MNQFFHEYSANSNSFQQVDQPLNALDLAAFNDPEEWQLYLEKGAFLYALGRYQEAQQVAEAVLLLHPDNAEAYHAMGSALHGQGQYTEALECFEQAIALKPDLAMAHVGKAYALTDMKEFESALQAFDTALELDPKLAIAHANKGSVLVELGRYEDAIRSLDQALELSLDEPVAGICYAKKCTALALSGKYEQALAAFDQAIARYPRNIEFLVGKVGMLHALGRTEEAFALLQEADALDPLNAAVPYTRGETYLTLGQYKEALAAYDEAIQRQTNFAKAYVGKGIVLGSTGNPREAALVFAEALKLDPENIDAYNHISNAFLILGLPQQALEAAEMGLQFNPNVAELYRKQGLALEDLQRYPEALTAYEKATRLDPELADAHHDKGVLLDKMGRPEAALESLNAALALNPQQHLSYHSKAIVLHRLRRYSEAIEACDAALKLDPGFQPAQMRKARVQADLAQAGQTSAPRSVYMLELSQIAELMGRQRIEVFPAQTKRARGRLKRRPVGIIALCILLVLALSILHSILPAGAATLTITPQSKDLTLPYTLTAGDSTDLASSHVRGRMLTYKTSTQSQSTSVQSNGYLPPSSAHGSVVFSQVSAKVTITNFNGIDIGNGLTISLDDSAIMEPGHTYTLPAHVEQEGSKGNLPADSIDGVYTLSSPLLVDPNAPSAFISNPEPFTGGADAYNGPVVSNTDTETLLSPLYTRNLEEAQQYFQSHLQPGEALLNNITCNQHETDSPPIGSAGTSVKVSLFSNCQVEVYDQQGLNAALVADAHRQAQSNFDPHFVLLPPLQVTISEPGTAGPGDSISLIADSKWRVLLDKSGVQAVQRALVGLSQDDARALLLNRFSSRTSSLNVTWWWGGHLPANPNAIRLIVHYPSS